MYSIIINDAPVNDIIADSIVITPGNLISLTFSLAATIENIGKARLWKTNKNAIDIRENDVLVMRIEYASITNNYVVPLKEDGEIDLEWTGMLKK